jgi:RsiW-degrading membrane proteinase PrsW (M82 family)
MGEDGRVTDPDLQDPIVFAREKAKRTLPVALLVLLGLTAMYLPLPKRFVAFVPLILAVVLTVRLLRFLSDRTGREKIWPVVTLVIAGMLLSTLAVQVAFYDTVSAYEECLAGAQTSIAAGSCAPLRDAGLFGLVVR